MPSFEIMAAFLLASAIFAYMPGPSTLYAGAQTMARGRNAGWMAALGIHVGGYIHVLAAAFGLAILCKTVPTIYMILKLAGAAYLVWLGLRLFFAGRRPTNADMEISAKSPRRAFWESVSVEILNPKTAIFYLGFLPQFTEADASLPIWAQLLVLGMIVNLIFSSADVLCVLLAYKITRWMRNSQSASQLAQRIGGSLLIGLGFNVAINRQ